MNPGEDLHQGKQTFCQITELPNEQIKVLFHEIHFRAKKATMFQQLLQAAVSNQWQ